QAPAFGWGAPGYHPRPIPGSDTSVRPQAVFFVCSGQLCPDFRVSRRLSCAVVREIMGQPLRVLIVEDSKDDANLLLHAVRSGGYEPVYEVVDTLPAMRAALESQDWDVITSDHAMPQFRAPAALAVGQELRPNVPLIIVSGEIDLNLAVS